MVYFTLQRMKQGVEGAETAYVSLDSFSQENFAPSSKEDSEIQKETDEKGVDK